VYYYTFIIIFMILLIQTFCISELLPVPKQSESEGLLYSEVPEHTAKRWLQFYLGNNHIGLKLQHNYVIGLVVLFIGINSTTKRFLIGHTYLDLVDSIFFSPVA